MSGWLKQYVIQNRFTMLPSVRLVKRFALFIYNFQGYFIRKALVAGRAIRLAAAVRSFLFGLPEGRHGRIVR